jgi:ribosome-associated protein
MLNVTAEIRIPDGELAFTYVRSSGPGGQNVNKVSSKAVLRWSPMASAGLPEAVRERFVLKFATRLTSAGELIISSQRFRDQQRNADDCLEKLRQMLLSAARKPVPRRPTKPTRGSQRRRLEAKRVHSRKKRHRRGPFHHDD